VARKLFGRVLEMNNMMRAIKAMCSEPVVIRHMGQDAQYWYFKVAHASDLECEAVARVTRRTLEVATRMGENGWHSIGQLQMA
jgi:hypothetical protein